MLPLLVLREELADRGWIGRHLAPLLVFAGGVFVAVGPLMVFFAQHPVYLLGRFNQVSIFGSGAVGARVQDLGLSGVAIVAQQLATTFLVFNATRPHAFFISYHPLLTPLPAVLLVFGAVLAVTRLRDRRYFALLFTLVAILVAAGLTVDPPNGPRLVAVVPFAALLVGLGSAHVSNVLALGRAAAARPLAGAMALLFVGTGVWGYFVEYPRNLIATPTPTEAATELAYYARDMRPGARLILFEEGWLTCGSHATLAFIAPGRICVDVESGPQASAISVSPDDVIVAVRGRASDAERVANQLGHYQRKVISQPGGGPELLFAFEPAP